MSTLAERLGEAELYSTVTLKLADGTTIEGKASPINYVPDDSLRMELRPEGENSSRRYAVEAHCEDGEWEPPTVREIDPATESDWEDLGTVEDFSVET